MTTYRGQIYLDLEAGERDRDAALAAVGKPDWIERATRVVVRRLAGQECLAESFRVACEAEGVSPAHPNGWGALTMALAKAGIIEDTGRVASSKSVKSRARRQPVWRVAG